MNLKKLISAAAAGIIALSAIPAAGNSPSEVFAADKSRVSVHDPSVIKDGNTYYVFGSHIDAARTSDLQNWKTFTNGYAKTNNV